MVSAIHLEKKHTCALTSPQKVKQTPDLQKKKTILVRGIWYTIYLLLRPLDFKNSLPDGTIEYFNYHLHFKRVSKAHITFNISGYLLAGTIIAPRLPMVQCAAVSTQRSDISAAPHLKYSPSPVIKMFVIQGQLPGLASCPPVILLSLSCSAHFALIPHDAEKAG